MQVQTRTPNPRNRPQPHNSFRRCPRSTPCLQVTRYHAPAPPPPKSNPPLPITSDHDRKNRPHRTTPQPAIHAVAIRPALRTLSSPKPAQPAEPNHIPQTHGTKIKSDTRLRKISRKQNSTGFDGRIISQKRGRRHLSRTKQHHHHEPPRIAYSALQRPAHNHEPFRRSMHNISRIRRTI
jgi:hypothetical protein